MLSNYYASTNELVIGRRLLVCCTRSPLLDRAHDSILATGRADALAWSTGVLYGNGYVGLT